MLQARGTVLQRCKRAEKERERETESEIEIHTHTHKHMWGCGGN